MCIRLDIMLQCDEQTHTHTHTHTHTDRERERERESRFVAAVTAERVLMREEHSNATNDVRHYCIHR